jgi:hypothetical protein
MTIFDSKIYESTTLVRTIDRQGNDNQGTGFFFRKLTPQIHHKDFYYEDREVIGNWIITNRHVVLLEDENGQEYLPESLYFHFPETTGRWKPVKLLKEDLKNRLLVNSNKIIDVVAIDILNLKYHSGISEDDMPNNRHIDVPLGCDILAVGYPEEFYDEVNKFPIVKSGIVSSPYDLDFNGEPKYLIDAKLFQGSSGSLILSKPIKTYEVKGGTFYEKSSDELVFLGIYSGAPYIEKNTIETGNLIIIKREDYNLGIVWHPKTVLETINNGIPFEE